MGSSIFYRRNLPHYQPPNGAFFVTFRLANSLPVKIIDELKREYHEKEKKLKTITGRATRENSISELRRKYFGKFDKLLGSSITGPQWLKNNKIANIVESSLHYYDS